MTGPAAAPRKPVILTVDDDPAVSRAVARDLRRHYGEKFRIVRAESGPDALETLHELKLRGETVVEIHTENVSMASVKRAPGMRSTSAVLNPTPGQITSLAELDIDAATYAAGGPIELMAGDMVFQSGLAVPVIGKVLSASTNSVQILTLVGPGV